MGKSGAKDLGKLSSQEVINFELDGQQFSEVLENLTLGDISPDKVRVALDRAPSKYAYWSNLLAEVNGKIRAAEAEYEYWYAKAYSDIDSEEPKKTESWKKNQVIIVNTQEWKKRIRRNSELQLVKDHLSTLVKAYEMQSRTLQTVAGLLRAEMEHIE